MKKGAALSSLGAIAAVVMPAEARAANANAKAEPAQASQEPAGGKTPSPQVATAANGSVLQEIVVTAERRETNLQRTPLAVTSFTREELEAKGIAGTVNLDGRIPNFMAYNGVGLGTTVNYFLRGAGNSESLATFDAPVGTYIDDIYIARQLANNIDLLDVARVEVLRGPQGTLFGRNTTAGAVVITTTKPRPSFEALGSASYGRFNEVRLKGSVNVPISPNLFTRFSAFRVKDDGWQRSVITDEKYNFQKAFGVRGAVRFEPSSNLTWDLASEFIKDNHENIQSIVDPVLSKTNHSAGNDGPWQLGTPYLNDVFQRNCQTGNGPLEWARNNCTANEIRNTNIYSTISINANHVKIDLITGYRNLKEQFSIPLKAGTLPFRTFELPLSNDSRHKQFSQEIKVSGAALQNRLQYTAGIFYMSERNSTTLETAFSKQATGILSVLDLSRFKNSLRTYAVYGQGDWEVFDNLTATAGLRWTHETKTIDSFDHTNTKGVNFNLDTIRSFGIPTEVTTKKLSPRFALKYQVTPNFMTYISATRGFKSGGWNARASTAMAMTHFNDETVWSCEGGWRSELFDRHIRFNTTFFTVTYKNLQLPSLLFIPGPGQTPIFVTNNAGAERVKGVEVELEAVPVSGLTLSANFGLQKAKYVELGSGVLANGVTLATVPRQSPHFSGQLGASYKLPVPTGSINANADARFTSSFWNTVQNAPSSFNLGYQTVDASLGYEHQSGNWGVAVLCTNCLNERYWTTDFLNGRFLGDPKRYMVRLNIRLR